MDNQERVRLEKELQDAREQARKGGYDPDTQPSSRIIDLNRRLAEMQKAADTEADVYNHLVNFFARYYAEGDFISQRRYSSGGRLTLSLTTVRMLSCTGPTRINTTSRRRQIMRPMSSLPVNGVCAWRSRRQITRGTM